MTNGDDYPWPFSAAHQTFDADGNQWDTNDTGDGDSREEAVAHVRELSPAARKTDVVVHGG